MTCRAAFVGILVCLAGLITAVPVTGSEVVRPASKKVILIPGRDFRIDPDKLFFDPSEPPPRLQEMPQLTREASAVLAAEPEIELVDLSSGQPVSAPQGTASRHLVVMGMLHLGIERYRDIRLPEAISSLEDGISAALASDSDVLVPAVVSDLYLYLGLSRLETSEPDLAHIALKQMFGHMPERRFRQGWFPAREERALRAAALDFVKSPARENPFESTERALGFLRERGADALVYVFLESDPEGGDRLETRVFEVSRKDAGSVEVMRDSRPYRGVESVSMAISSWLACADLPSRTDTLKRLPRVFLDTGFSYSMFAQDNSTRTGFHNIGLSIGTAYQIQPGLDTFLRLSFYQAREDSYGDLLDDFFSFRASIGVGYSAVFNWGRVFTHFGFEMDYLSGFKSSTEPRCKLWPDDPDLCPSSQVTEPSFLFGAVGLLGVNVFVSRSVFVMVQAGISGYFVSNSALVDLNFPFVVEFGFGYAFF
ncbi:MAG TPA: hypothetical protein PKG82_00480 [Myxococcota bacterium]|nr:hypothetical protein [Myxococcota bacterium]